MFRDIAITFINVSTNVLEMLLLLYVLSSWVVSRDSKFFKFIESLIKPVLAPIRKILPPKGGMDLAPIIAFLSIEVIGAILIALLS